MKKLIYVIALLTVCVACSKKTESPDLSLVLQGIYRLSFLQINRQDIIPSSINSGTVNITRNDKDVVNINLTLTDSNGTRSFALGKFTLKDEGGGTVSIYDNINTAALGRGSSTEISFSVVLGPSSFGLRGSR